jgi:carbon monoxide dehydrogenase subunit G
VTVRAERVIDVAAAPEAVWPVLNDHRKRAEAISVVDAFTADGDRATWHLELPIPLIGKTITVHTETVERDRPRYVRFVGDGPALTVTGEHEIEPTETGSRIHNRFVVDGDLPGIERDFKRHLDGELDNLEAVIRASADPGQDG